MANLFQRTKNALINLAQGAEHAVGINTPGHGAIFNAAHPAVVAVDQLARATEQAVKQKAQQFQQSARQNPNGLIYEHPRNAFQVAANLPGAITTEAKDIGQSVARSVPAIASTIYSPKRAVTLTPKGTAQNALFGAEPIRNLAASVQTNAPQVQKTTHLPSTVAKTIAGAGFLAGTLGNFIPGSEGDSSVVKAIAKSKTPEEIAVLLDHFKLPALTRDRVAEQLATVSNPTKVKSIIDANIAKNLPTAIPAQTDKSLAPRAGVEPTTLRSSSGRSAAELSRPEVVPPSVKPVISPSEVQKERIPQTRQAPLPPPSDKIVENPLASSLPGNIPQASNAVNDPIQKVITALQEAKPIRKGQELLYSQERSKRLGQAINVGKNVSGEKGYFAQLSKLKGELPKVQYESIRNQVGQPEIDAMFEKVRQSPLLSEFDKISAQQGLAKIFGNYGGQVPTEGELRLLNKSFGPDFVKAVQDKLPFLQKLTHAGVELANIPRSLMASFDLSAPFRQGLFLSARYPKQFFGSFADMFKAFGSDKAYRAIQEDIASRPSFELMNQAHLALTDMNSVLTAREEQFMSSWAERIPGVGRVVKASGRAYTGFLNKLRADTFDHLLSQAKLTGIDIKENPGMVEDLAKFINSASGRGNLGSMERAATTLNSVLFSPRLLASRLNLLNPLYYMSLDPFVRKQALQSLFALAGAGATVLGLAKLGGAEVGTDPRSADFGKIKIGNTRLDIWGGFQQPIRLASQLISGKLISSTTGKEFTLGEGYKPITRLDILERFFQGKENPVVSFATDFLRGTNFQGQPFDVKSEVAQRFIPMLAQDAYDIAKDNPSLIPIMGLGALGFGVQTYGPSAPAATVKPAKASAADNSLLTQIEQKISQAQANRQESNAKKATAALLSKYKLTPGDTSYKTFKSILSKKSIPMEDKAKVMDALGMDKEKLAQRFTLEQSQSLNGAQFSQDLNRLKTDSTTKAADIVDLYRSRIDELANYMRTLDPKVDQTTKTKIETQIEKLTADVQKFNAQGGFKKPKKLKVKKAKGLRPLGRTIKVTRLRAASKVRRIKVPAVKSVKGRSVKPPSIKVTRIKLGLPKKLKARRVRIA